jgi:hypothetical protein
LKNPRYAGAFAYGRTEAKKTLQGTVNLPPLTGHLSSHS